jgi:hypothetical protein
MLLGITKVSVVMHEKKVVQSYRHFLGSHIGWKKQVQIGKHFHDPEKRLRNSCLYQLLRRNVKPKEPFERSECTQQITQIQHV